jgi:hypothetical protein
MTSAPQTRDIGPLSEAIDNQLWECIDSRLERGDSLVRPRDFQLALEADYAGITGQRMSRTVRRLVANTVVTINRSRPERYVAAGVQNSARRAFESTCSKLRWDPTQIQNFGLMAIARLKSQNRVRELLAEVGLRSSAIDAAACVQHALQVASGERESLTRHDPAEPFMPQNTDGTNESDHPADVIDEQEPSLSNEERRGGALVKSVETRIAGTTLKMPHTLMLSPEDSGTYLLAQRNSETGELEPLNREGSQRQVQRGIDGVWRELS